jgi:hypothetical protein
MRPAEIDYNSRDKHYFDISNGEVLVGENEQQVYAAQHDNPELIVPLGNLLRQTIESLPYEHYDQADCNEWNEDQFKQFGTWILSILPPPESNYQRVINMSVFNQANKLGVGPSAHDIIRTFNSLSNFYKEIRAENVLAKNQFDDWTIDDFISYLKYVGGDKRPEISDIRRLSRQDPSHPSWKIINDRFKNIGGFRKIQELAGYTVVRLWDRDDFIDWGVKFMEANDGKMPTVTMLDYFSTLQRGPTAVTIYSNFDNIPSYREEIERKYNESQQDKKEAEETLIGKINDDLLSGRVPEELFSSADNEISEINCSVRFDTTCSSADTALFSKESPLPKILNKLGIEELFARYGKYSILCEVAPGMTKDTKISIACGVGSDRSFESLIRRHHRIPLGDIEYAGLTLGVFDYVWPLDQHLTTLKLDDGFDKYKRKIWDKKKEYRRRKKHEKQIA